MLIKSMPAMRVSAYLARRAAMTALTMRRRAALFRGAMGSLVVVILRFVATTVPGEDRGQAEQPPTAQPHRDNERIVTEAEGPKVVLVRWPGGSRDNVVTFRIPLPYVLLVGALQIGASGIGPASILMVIGLGSSMSQRTSYRMLERTWLKVFVVVGGVIAALCLGAVIAIRAFADSVEDKILNDLQENSEGRPSQNYIRTFDLICFTQHSDLVKQNFLREDERLGANFSESLKACGIDRSCCNLSSDTEIVGLIKNGQIRCVEASKFDYWLENNSPRCMAPDRIRVQHLSQETGARMSAPPKFTPGRPAYLITERRE